MPLWKLIILAIVQGFAELLPISSSAHVVVAEELMGLNAAAPKMTLLLVMLHTGTMIAVIVYFWRQWRHAYFQSAQAFKTIAGYLVVATLLTGAIGYVLQLLAVHLLLRGVPHAQIEDLFNHLGIIAPALAAAGIITLVAGLLDARASRRSAQPRATSASDPSARAHGLGMKQAALIGAVQGLVIPFRGLSRSGVTISTGMLSGVPKASAETFSFALVILLTPAADGRELWRLLHADHAAGLSGLWSAVLPSLLGALLAFLAGLLALRWLSRWLEGGRWYIFGLYCLLAAGGVATLYYAGLG